MAWCIPPCIKPPCCMWDISCAAGGGLCCARREEPDKKLVSKTKAVFFMILPSCRPGGQQTFIIARTARRCRNWQLPVDRVEFDGRHARMRRYVVKTSKQGSVRCRCGFSVCP